MLFFFRNSWFLSCVVIITTNWLIMATSVCYFLSADHQWGQRKGVLGSFWLTSSSDCLIHTVKPLQKLVLVSWDQGKEIRIWCTSCISNFLLSFLSSTQTELHCHSPQMSFVLNAWWYFAQFLLSCLEKKYKMIGLLASPVVNEASHWWEHIHNYVFCPF